MLVSTKANALQGLGFGTQRPGLRAPDAAGLVDEILPFLRPCTSFHPFMFVNGIGADLGECVAGRLEVAGVDCSGAYAQRLIDVATLEARNFALLVRGQSGGFSEVYLPGLPQFGLCAHFGPLRGQVDVCLGIETAALLHVSTGRSSVAVMHIDNLARVVQQLAVHRPYADVTLAFEPGELEQTHDRQVLDEFKRVAANHALCLVTPGASPSFRSLRLSGGVEAIRQTVSLSTIEIADRPGVGGIEKSRTVGGVPATLPARRSQVGSSVMHDLVSVIERSLVMSQASAVVVALWIIFTHVVSRFGIAPLLLIVSPERSCGKTTLMTLLGRLCHSPFCTSHTSGAAIFRLLDEQARTILMDEAHNYLNGSDDLVELVNAGYQRTLSWVTRGRGQAATEYISVFGPKAIAMVGTPPTVLVERALTISLERKLPNQAVETVHAAGPGDLELLSARVKRWVEENAAHIVEQAVDRLGNCSDRAEDNALPLLKIAACLDGPWLKRASDALATTSVGDAPTLDTGELLLRDIQYAFEAAETERLKTTELLDILNAMHESPWCMFSRGRPMAPSDLAKLLRPFHIESDQEKREGKVSRGFRRSQFQQAFARYLATAPKALAA